MFCYIVAFVGLLSSCARYLIMNILCFVVSICVFFRQMNQLHVGELRVPAIIMCPQLPKMPFSNLPPHLKHRIAARVSSSRIKVSFNRSRVCYFVFQVNCAASALSLSFYRFFILFLSRSHSRSLFLSLSRSFSLSLSPSLSLSLEYYYVLHSAPRCLSLPPSSVCPSLSSHSLCVPVLSVCFSALLFCVPLLSLSVPLFSLSLSWRVPQLFVCVSSHNAGKVNV